MSISNPDHFQSASQVTEHLSSRCHCLWQPCNRFFAPSYPAQVFCCEECRLASVEFERLQRRKESTRKANQKYRRTDRGRLKRADQQRRRRIRFKEERLRLAQCTPVSPLPPEGYTNPPKHRPTKKSSCRRPGCFVSWVIDPRTPHKKFCSSMCDNALRAACTRVERYYLSRGYVGKIISSNRMKVLLAKPGSRGQLRAFESVVLRC